MPLTYMRDGEAVLHVRGEDWEEEQRRMALVTSKTVGGRQTKLPPVPDGMYRVEEKTYSEPDESGAMRVYRPGDLISTEEAVRLGLLKPEPKSEAKKERAVEDKKAPRPSAKRKKVEE